MDAKIVNAIRLVRKGVKPLADDSFNPHGKYRYVSIDSYYRHVLSVLTDNGLVTRTRQTSWEFIELSSKDGPKCYVKANFSFDLFVEDIQELDYMVATISLPMVGPQTTGQLYSYAEKVFLRVMCGVATGENDADGAEPDTPLQRAKPASSSTAEDFLEGQPAKLGSVLSRDPLNDPLPDHMLPPKNEAPPHDPSTGEIIEADPSSTSVGDVCSGSTSDGDPVCDPKKIHNEAQAEIVAKIFETWLPDIKTSSRLLDWHAENVAALEAVQRVAPAVRERIKGMFSERNMQLKKDQK